MRKKITKGNYGYLKAQRKRQILQTALFFGISFLVFLTGFLTTGTKNNLLTVVAILGCLPACKSLVESIMYCRTGGCSEEAYGRIRAYEKKLPILYDLYLTSYEKNFQVESLSLKGNTICGYAPADKCDKKKGQEHLANMLLQNGHKGMAIKLFPELPKYLEWLEIQEPMAEEELETVHTILKLICNLSL